MSAQGQHHRAGVRSAASHRRADAGCPAFVSERTLRARANSRAKAISPVRFSSPASTGAGGVLRYTAGRSISCSAARPQPPDRKSCHASQADRLMRHIERLPGREATGKWGDGRSGASRGGARFPVGVRARAGRAGSRLRDVRSAMVIDGLLRRRADALARPLIAATIARIHRQPSGSRRCAARARPGLAHRWLHGQARHRIFHVDR